MKPLRCLLMPGGSSAKSAAGPLPILRRLWDDLRHRTLLVHLTKETYAEDRDLVAYFGVPLTEVHIALMKNPVPGPEHTLLKEASAVVVSVEADHLGSECLGGLENRSALLRTVAGNPIQSVADARPQPPVLSLQLLVFQLPPFQGSFVDPPPLLEEVRGLAL
jgi:hypothetical protein